MTHSFWWLACDALAVYRLAVLVSKDEIARPLRNLLIGTVRGTTTIRRPGVALFLTCPWCLSIWVAAPVVVLTTLAPTIWQYAAAGLACSAVAGFLAER